MDNQSEAGPVKVAVVISNLTLGGAERQVVELCNHIDRQEFDLQVFILSDHAPLAQQMARPDERLHVVAKRNKFDVGVIFRLAREFRRYQIDVVHGFLFDAEIASRIAGRIAGVKAVIGSERNTRNNYGSIKKTIYRLTSRWTDACIANSNAGADFHRSRTGLPADAYHVVHNGVDTKRFSPNDESALRAELGIDADHTIVGMFGSFKHQKNHPLLLDAAHRLIRGRSDIRFVFVGTTIHEGYSSSGEYSSSVADRVTELGLDDYCLFLGGKDDIERYYNLCDITALPSLFEGTPNVALESMACAVPVVATDVSDNSYVIPDGKAGFIVPLGDPDALAGKLEMLIDDKKLREKLGSGARDWVMQEFSLEKMSSKMGSVYTKVLQSTRN